jgi:hypothetical protein
MRREAAERVERWRAHCTAESPLYAWLSTSAADCFSDDQSSQCLKGLGRGGGGGGVNWNDWERRRQHLSVCGSALKYGHQLEDLPRAYSLAKSNKHLKQGAHTLHLTPHISHLTPHTSHTTPHTSHLTPHTSHLTPHTSHLTSCLP